MQRITSEHVQEWFLQHDEEQISVLDGYVSRLEWGSEAFSLGRMLAKYDDQRGRLAQARTRLEHMLTCAEHPAERTTLHLDLARMALRWQQPELLHLCAAASEIEPGWWSLEARLQTLISGYYRLTGTPTQAVAPTERAYTIYRDHQDKTGQALAMILLADNDLHRGEFRQAVERTGELLRKQTGFFTPELRAFALHRRGTALRMYLPERPALALRYYQQACEIHRQRRDPLFLAQALTDLELLHVECGDYRAALDCLRERNEALRQAQFPDCSGPLAACLLDLHETWRAQSKPAAGFSPEVQAAVGQLIAAARRSGESPVQMRLLAAQLLAAAAGLPPADCHRLGILLTKSVAGVGLTGAAYLAWVCCELLDTNDDLNASAQILLKRFGALAEIYAGLVMVKDSGCDRLDLFTLEAANCTEAVDTYRTSLAGLLQKSSTARAAAAAQVNVRPVVNRLASQSGWAELAGLFAGA